MPRVAQQRREARWAAAAKKGITIQRRRRRGQQVQEPTPELQASQEAKGMSRRLKGKQKLKAGEPKPEESKPEGPNQEPEQEEPKPEESQLFDPVSPHETALVVALMQLCNWEERFEAWRASKRGARPDATAYWARARQLVADYEVV